MEKNQGLGGIWNPDSGYTWDSMTTNTSIYTSRFTDFPWPEGTEAFPAGKEFYKYIKSYSDRFGVTERIQFNSEVTSVKKLENDTYRVEWTQKTADSSGKSETK